MSFPVEHHEPARGFSIYAARFERVATLAEAQAARSGQLLAARAEALFASDLSAQREYTTIEVAAAIRHAIGAHDGVRGCAGQLAAAYGERPETAASRMRWARAVIEGTYARSLAGASR
jgi:hypothetical protein